MLKISPETNRDVIKEILTKHSLNGEFIILSAYEDEEIVGYTVSEQDGHSLRVIEFEVLSCSDYTSQTDDEKFISELLIRSTANYAANREMILLTGENNNMFFTAVQLGVNSAPDSVRIFIPKLFGKCSN